MTIEELKGYVQIRTPDYAALANNVNRAKGDKRTMAQFAEDTGIGASTLSRIANMKIQKPLSVDVLISIYENRAEQEDTYLLDALARANGLASPDYVEKVNAQYRGVANRNEEISRANMMKNSIVASVLSAGIPIRRVFNGHAMSNVEEARGMPSAWVGRPCDFFMALDDNENISTINVWKIYLYPRQIGDDFERTATRDARMEIHLLIQRLATMLLRDAWQPESLLGVKTSFAFIDKKLHSAFIDAMQTAKVNNEMSVLLLDPINSYKVVSETWISGHYQKMTDSSIFDSLVSGEGDGNEDYDTYESEDMEDTE